MSQARGKMFDQILHYLFQNISADSLVSREERLSFTEELRIEVSVVKDPASEDQERTIS